jgi:fumarate hydratase subunit beta
MIGKGLRAPEVTAAITRHGGVYFAAIGGAAALMSHCVKNVEMIAFEDLGTEAIRRLTLEEMPVVVATDSRGNDIYRRRSK